MEKRIFSALLALIMAIALFPMTALAVATGTYAVNLEVSNNTGTSEIEVSMTVKSEALTVKNLQSVVFVYDASVLTPIIDGDAVKCVAESGWEVKPVKSTVAEDDTNGYIVLQPYTTSAVTCTDAVVLATVYFELASDKTISDITSASIRYASLEEAEALNASAVVSITNGSISQYYLPSDTIQSPTLLGNIPAIEWNFDVSVPTIKGTVVLDGEFAYDNEIVANVSGVNVSDNSSLIYKWTRDGEEIADVTGNSYVLTADDISKVVNVEVSYNGYDGTLTSNNTSTVAKKVVDAPYAVQLASITENSFVIDDYNSAYEYACIPTETELSENDFKVYTDGVISNLALETTYDLYARVAETDTAFASDASEVDVESTLGHKYSLTYNSDDTCHWKDCVNDGCTEQTSKENHNFVEFVDDEYLKSEATTEAPATYYKVCSVCGKLSDETFTYGDPIGGHTHNYGAWTKLDDNQHQRVCDSNPTHIETANHNWAVDSVVNATCTTEGSRVYKCSDCGATKTETIPALTHSYGAWTKLDDNQHQRVCANDASHVEKANHNWVVNSTTNATCTTEGSRVYKCSDCGATKTEAISVVAHNYVSHKCTGCGKIDPSYTGLLTISNGQLGYYTNGETASKTGLVKQPDTSDYYAGKYVYLINGEMQDTYTGIMVNGSYGYRYVVDGVWADTKTGLVKQPDSSEYFAGKYVYIKSGKMKDAYTGIMKNGSYGYRYVVDGVWADTKTGLVKQPSGSEYYASKYVYLKKGKMQDTYTGIMKNGSYGYRYVVKGVWNDSKTGLVKQPSGSEYYAGKYVYLKKGKMQDTYTGLMKNGSYGYRYVVKGVWADNKTGVFKMASGTEYKAGKNVYIKAGKFMDSYNGKVTYNKVKYKVSKGIATKA